MHSTLFYTFRLKDLQSEYTHVFWNVIVSLPFYSPCMQTRMKILFPSISPCCVTHSCNDIAITQVVLLNWWILLVWRAAVVSGFKKLCPAQWVILHNIWA